MNTIYKHATKALLAASIGLVCLVCQKSDDTFKIANLKSVGADMLPTLNSDHYSIKDSILCFSTMRIADSMSTILNQMPRDEFEQWEKQTGFLSQRTLYRHCTDEMNSAQTAEELWETINKYSDILKMEKDMVKPNFWLPYASISNREGIHYEDNWLVKSTDTSLFKIKNGTKQEIALYADSEESFFTENIIFLKRKAYKASFQIENNPNTKLKTGLYCGYGWYGGFIEHFCFSPNEKYSIEFEMWHYSDITEEFYCNFAHKYKFSILAQTYRKRFFGWVAYDTDIAFKNIKFQAIYPMELDHSEPCETCPGYPSVCNDWTCETGEFFIGDFVVENMCYGFLDPPMLLGMSILNPISPNMLNDNPKFQYVHGEATFPEMEGVHAVINYGYSGTQGCYCEQR